MTKRPDSGASSSGGEAEPIDGSHDDPAVRRRRVFDRAWFWIPLVVVVVAGALLASFVVERRRQADEAVPPLDQQQFCATASDIQAFPQLTVDLSTGGSAEFQRFQSELDRLASVTPDGIARDIRAIRASLDPVIEVLGNGGGGTEALNHALQVLDEQSNSVTDQAGRVSAYTARWCGFDLMSSSDTTPPG